MPPSTRVAMSCAPANAACPPYDPRLSPKTTSLGRLSRWQIDPLRIDRVEQRPACGHRGFAIGDECQRAGKERVLHRRDGGVAALDVFESGRHVVVHPAAAGGGHYCQDGTVEAAGALEFVDDPLRDTVDGIRRLTAGVHADGFASRPGRSARKSAPQTARYP